MSRRRGNIRLNVQLLHHILKLPKHINIINVSYSEHGHFVDVICESPWMPEIDYEKGLKIIEPVYEVTKDSRELIKLIELRGLDT